MRLASRAAARATTPRLAVVTGETATDAYAPQWVEVPSVEVPSTTTPDFLDPCGIAGNEHMWIDVTDRAAGPVAVPSGSATDGVWMPAAYELPAEPAPKPFTTDIGIPVVGPCECPNGQCGVPD